MESRGPVYGGQTQTSRLLPCRNKSLVFAKFFQFFNRSQRSKGAGIPSQSLNIGKQLKIYKNAVQAIQTRLGAKWGPIWGP